MIYAHSLTKQVGTKYEPQLGFFLFFVSNYNTVTRVRTTLVGTHRVLAKSLRLRLRVPSVI